MSFKLGFGLGLRRSKPCIKTHTQTKFKVYTNFKGIVFHLIILMGWRDGKWGMDSDETVNRRRTSLGTK